MAEHKAEEIEGRIKEGVGDVTGDKGLQREGKVDQGSAKTKRAVDKTTEKVKQAVNPNE